MAAGDKEILESLQETTTRNVKAVVAHANETRDLVRELEEKVRHLDGLVRQYEQKFELLQKQIAVLQTKLFSGGS
jgi:peptidoglycan hydrolase CwlO-like protein